MRQLILYFSHQQDAAHKGGVLGHDPGVLEVSTRHMGDNTNEINPLSPPQRTSSLAPPVEQAVPPKSHINDKAEGYVRPTASFSQATVLATQPLVAGLGHTDPEDGVRILS